MGGPTVETILANRVAPGPLDHYLAHTGYEAQQTDEPEDPNRPDNLWHPVAGDHGALLGIGVGLVAMGLAATNRARYEEGYSHVPDAGLGPKERAELKHLIER